MFLKIFQKVSTHSRPKAAGSGTISALLKCSCFNTQPPEGGWGGVDGGRFQVQGFNTQPPEGGWAFLAILGVIK